VDNPVVIRLATARPLGVVHTLPQK
jgi:hypothetical protein